MQPFRAHSSRWLISLSLSAMLIAMHTLYWQWLCRRLEADWQGWAARRSVAGWHFGTGTAVIGGWPLAAEMTLPDPVATAPDGSGWAGERMVLRINLLRPGRLLVDAPGAQQILFGNADRVHFTAMRQHLDLPLTVDVAPGEFDLAATQISLPPSWRTPFGPSITSLSAAGRISEVGGLANSGIGTIIRQWHDSGGSMDLRKFALLWGSLDVSGHATLALDERLQPQGDGTAAVAGFAEAIAQLADAGRIPRHVAMLASGALALMSGGNAIAEVPFQLRSGRLSVRQIPLLSIPEVVWPNR